MINVDKVYNQINNLTSEIIASGLCDAQNFPSRKKHPGNAEEIGISNSDNAIFLKNMSYSEMFKQLNKTKNYNIKMIDGALISMSYRFIKNQLTAHRLSFFPSPDLEIFQNEPEIYLSDELYSDIIDKRIVTVPIRFDYDYNESVFKPIEHPISHLTIGQYENCRIPVSSALTPYQFLSFIIINFYNTAHKKIKFRFTVHTECFGTTIFSEEKKIVHVTTPIY